MRREIHQLEENLIYFSKNRVEKLAREILDKKETLFWIERGIEQIYNRLAQRKVELQLKVEAEYGLNKARLLSTRGE